MSLLNFYPQLSSVRQALKDSGSQVFLVGGALRNYYLNRPGTDLDFAVEKNAITIARKLSRRLKGAFVLLDEEHGSARIVKKIDGVVWTFDLTDWRGKTIVQDLSRRDFTINAFAVDVLNEGKLLEVKNSTSDLKAGVVRMVALKTFQDDPLRLLRAFTLQATLGFKIEAKTCTQIKKEAHLIAKVSAERIAEELFKILASPRAYETLVHMDQLGLLAHVIPQVTVMYKVHQGGYHHLDVWRHSLEVVHQMENIVTDADDEMKTYLNENIGGAHSRLSLLKMAAVLHDIGKPETRKKEGARMTFHGHEHVGERITRQICHQLKLSAKERYFLENSVRMHLRPGYLSNFKRPSEKAVFRYMRDTKQEAASLAVLAMADQAATRGPLTTQAKHNHHAKICRMVIERYFEVKDEKPKIRLLTGNDLIKTLKLKPSPLFAKILSAVEEAAALGKITTKQEALAVVRKML